MTLDLGLAASSVKGMEDSKVDKDKISNTDNGKPKDYVGEKVTSGDGSSAYFKTWKWDRQKQDYVLDNNEMASNTDQLLKHPSFFGQGEDVGLARLSTAKGE